VDLYSLPGRPSQRGVAEFGRGRRRKPTGSGAHW